MGPLARVQNCDLIPTPLAEAERREFLDYCGGTPMHAPLAYHWARMIEMLHAVETIKDLLHDDDILGDDLVVSGPRALEGVGVIEAPRGTLIHHYRVDESDLVTMCNLIVSTTHNNQAMNEAIRNVAKRYLHGHKLTEGLLNHIEVAIRAFDPCLSCATHALGRMPLAVELVDAEGTVVARLSSDGDTARAGGAELMPAPVVVFAVGNRSRGDDALGPLLLERLAAVLDAEGRGSRFELIDDFQLQIEHALDLAGRRLALFIDAGTGTPAPFVIPRDRTRELRGDAFDSRPSARSRAGRLS